MRSKREESVAQVLARANVHPDVAREVLRVLAEPEHRTWDYRISKVERVVDGDTFDLYVSRRMDFGFHLTEDKEWGTRFRLLGEGMSPVDAWETNQAGGADATRFATTWVAQAIWDDVLRGQTFKTDHFGRWLIDLYRTDTGEHLAKALRDAGLTKQ